MSFLKALFLGGLLVLTLQAQTTPPAQPPVDEPKQFYSVGVGAQGLGPAQIFGYYSVSRHLATGTYLTQITEYSRLKGGNVGTCARAGVSKILWNIYPLSLGIVGDAGACQGTTGSATGAFAERGFATIRIKKSNWYFVETAETLKIAGTGNQVTISFGIAYGTH